MQLITPVKCFITQIYITVVIKLFFYFDTEKARVFASEKVSYKFVDKALPSNISLRCM